MQAESVGAREGQKSDHVPCFPPGHNCFKGGFALTSRDLVDGLAAQAWKEEIRV